MGGDSLCGFRRAGIHGLLFLVLQRTIFARALGVVAKNRDPESGNVEAFGVAECEVRGQGLSLAVRVCLA
jgi:hypothetical protein